MSTVVERAIRRYKVAHTAWRQQRTRELAALRFQVPELQWDDMARAARSGGTISGLSVPPRPILSITKVKQPVQLILNQAQAAQLGVNIHPISESANDENARIKQGLYRAIERDSNAQLARLSALRRAVWAGTGAYRITTAYCDDPEGDPFDQDIEIRPILSQGDVYFDPAAQRLDYSDSEYCFVGAWLSRSAFERQYPDAELPTADGMFADEMIEPLWVRDDGEEQAFLVTEYYEKEHQTLKLVNRATGATRERDVVSVTCYHIAGNQEKPLRKYELNGSRIPIVFVGGEELVAFDGQRRYMGMVEPAMDAQRTFNAAASAAVEIVALEPKAPFIGAEGQFEGHEDQWQQANVRNFPYLEYHPKTLDGAPLPPPQRAQADTSKLGMAMQLLAGSSDWTMTTTATFEPSLGNVPQKERSGKAILALQSQSDAGNSHFLTSLAEISMRYEAEVILELMPKVYDRPGRIARILDEHDETEAIMLNAPYVMDQKTKMPRQLMDEAIPPDAKEYNLQSGSYGVSVTIGKSYQTRLQQGADEIGQILTASPELMPLIGPLYFRFRDFPGAKEIADLLKKIQAKQYPELVSEKDQGSPEQAEAQLMAAQQQVTELQQQLQEAMTQLETDAAKQRATLEKADMDARSKLLVEKLQTDMSLQLAQIKRETDVAILGLEQRFEAQQSALQRAHELTLAQHEAAHEAALEAVKLDAAAEQSEKAAENERGEPK